MSSINTTPQTQLMDIAMRIREMREILSFSMEDMAEYAKRLIVMNHGCVQYDGTPREVFAHYRELEKIGLAAPQVTYIMHELARKGFEIDVAATTVDEAKESILKALRQ